jgi:hypothetical protein
MKNEAASLDWTGRPYGRRAEALHLADNLGPFGTLDGQKTKFSRLMPSVTRAAPDEFPEA